THRAGAGSRAVPVPVRALAARNLGGQRDARALRERVLTARGHNEVGGSEFHRLASSDRVDSRCDPDYRSIGGTPAERRGGAMGSNGDVQVLRLAARDRHFPGGPDREMSRSGPEAARELARHPIEVRECADSAATVRAGRTVAGIGDAVHGGELRAAVRTVRAVRLRGARHADPVGTILAGLSRSAVLAVRPRWTLRSRAALRPLLVPLE